MIRDADAADAGRCAAIYAPYVRDTAISFESEPPSAEEMAARIAAAQRAHAWLVLEDDGHVVGYAYGGPFMARAAYQWATAVSVYLDPVSHRTALAGIALPNEASVGLHRVLGFEPAGTYRRVGWKLGRWHDVAWYQRPLTDDDGAPIPLR